MSLTQLSTLIDYYLACLQMERREDLSLSRSQLGERFIPIADELPSTWKKFASSEPAHKALEQTVGRENVVALVAPLVDIRSKTQGRKFEPATGVFCSVSRGKLTVDPTDIWVGTTLREEVDESDYARIRDTLEQAATTGPRAFLAQSLKLLKEEGVSDPQVCGDVEELCALKSGTLAHFPGLWIVWLETFYDRGLVSDLKKLHPQGTETSGAQVPKRAGRSFSATALRALFSPSPPRAVRLSRIVHALSNPVQPTLSQAIALAQATQEPLTVITGPPGTGKTRIIVGLIIYQILQGQSVLLASRINQAVDSAVDLAERLMGKGSILRSGNPEAREELQHYLSWLSGLNAWPGEGELFPTDSSDQPLGTVSVNRIEKSLTLHNRRITRAARKMAAPQSSASLWSRWLLNRRLRSFQSSWQPLREETEILLRQIVPAQRAQERAALKQRMDALLTHARPHLDRLVTSMDSRHTRHRAFATLARLGFPIAVTNLTVSTNLPLEPGLFDLVIVDEASTCDPASLLPLLYRGKRAVIVGDPKQLPFIVGDGWKQVEPVPELHDADGVKFSAEFSASAFHLCAAIVGGGQQLTATLVSDRVPLLRDHFRCPPQIIAFSNEAFYGGELRLHTEERGDAVQVREVSGKHGMSRTGSRYNEAQLETAMLELRRLSHEFADASIGLVSPYRAFTDAARDRLLKDDTLRQRQMDGSLIIGTAHTFQGSEVDYLVFATVAGDNATNREIRWVEHANLFNVAVTRPRRQMIILVSPVLLAAGKLRLTTQLLNASQLLAIPRRSTQRSLVNDVGDWLHLINVPFRTAHRYRGYDFDFLDAADPPQWGIRIHTWENLAFASKTTSLQHVSDQLALDRWNLKVIDLTPHNWQQTIMRWVADQEVAGLMNQVPPHPMRVV